MPIDSIRAAGRHGPRQVDHPHAGDLRHEDLPALHLLDAADRETHALIEREPEAGHALVGERDPPRRRWRRNTGTTLPRLPTTLP